MKEIYKNIKDFERYSVSNFGNVKNNITGCVLSQRKATNGYLRVNLRKGNVKYEKPTTISVHRLVAEHFIPNDNNLCTVNHIDGDKTNNNVTNLEWLSNEDNLKHAWENGLMNKGEREFVHRRKHRVGKEVARLHNIESHNTPEYRAKAQRINAEAKVTTPVAQIDMKTQKIIRVFDNCHEAARVLFDDAKNKDRLISRCARNACKSAYGYNWSYV